MTEEQLEAFVAECWDSLSAVAASPREVIESLREGLERNRGLSHSRRMEGLRMAARDLLTMIGELSLEQREQLDGALYGRHEITIGRVRASVAIDWTKVARRGLRNEEEYYAAREVREDPAAHGVDIDPAVLDNLVQRYEDDLESNVS